MMNTETDLNDEKEATATRKPPEKEFFDRESDVTNALTDLQRRKRLFGILIACGAVLLAIILISKGCSIGPSQKKIKLQDDDKREIITQSFMERAIQNSQPKEDVIIQSSVQRSTKKKDHNYKSDIAVFLYKEDKVKTNDYQSSGEKQKVWLGIPTGTKVPAMLEDRVFSFNVAAPVLAVLVKDFDLNGKQLIPKGSKFLGEASVLKSVDRINVKFDLLIFPDGKEMRIRALALGDDGASGIRGRVDKHRDVKMLKAIGETLLGGASLFVGGVNRAAYSFEDQLRSNFAQNMTNPAGQDLRNVRTDESVSVEASTPVQVMILDAI